MWDLIVSVPDHCFLLYDDFQRTILQRTSTLVNDFRAKTSYALCCIHYIGNVIYYKFLHRKRSYGFNGKNVSIMFEFLFVSH